MCSPFMFNAKAGYVTLFSGVAVVSANDIWAVGQFGSSGGGGSVRNALTSTPSPQTLIERWNGSSWSVVASLNPGSGSDSLNAVAGVPASSQAWTVGAYNNGTPPVQTLTEFYCYTVKGQRLRIGTSEIPK